MHTFDFYDFFQPIPRTDDFLSLCRFRDIFIYLHF